MSERLAHPCANCPKARTCAAVCLEWRQWFAAQWQEIRGMFKREEGAEDGGHAEIHDQG